MPTPELSLDANALVRLLRTGPALYYVLDRQGVIRDAGEEALRLAPGPIIGLRFSDILVAFTKPLDFDDILCRPGPHVFTLDTAGGRPHSFRFSFAACGERIVCLGAQDAGETELLRETLLEANQELAVLAREQQRANASLEKINAQKNRFLGMAAHDLRSPISHVLYGADMLRDDDAPLGPLQAEALTIVEEAGVSMLRILDDLLDIANIEAGRFSLHMTPGDMSAKIQSVIDRLTPLAAAKDMRLSCRCPEAMPEIPFDAVRIEQLLTNLVTNAVKYAPPGTAIRIEAACTESALTVSVTDQGVGVSFEEREQIFEPFGRGQAQPTGGEKSTGLGLCIARSIARGHGGDLTVASPPGQGATFVFSLPLVRHAPESGEQRSAFVCLH